ncbi:nickel pincer cofactor biosynthesis protein LarB [Synechococcus sp. UW140]|uniref:nickel pincer cofactor biosynthesis protein LarB n=2 Tax=Synechococcus sp. UW140 TaxID=368503 RepID=UPI003137985E
MKDDQSEILHRLDLDRRNRLGMIEAVWGEHKTAEQIIAIAIEMQAAGELMLATRINQSKAAEIALKIPNIKYYPQARCLSLGKLPETGIDGFGDVAILTGGSSDISVASEAQLALTCHGIYSGLIADVGVAGLHRLMHQLPELHKYQVLIVCAGMEGALPTVVAGLLPQPIIAVPVSVGYGVSAGGTAALHGMLASCAPGLAVVNIDNGYGAAMAALRIIKGASVVDRR